MKPPVIGKKIHEEAVDSLIDTLERVVEADASLYIGYPIASTVDSSVAMPALLISSIFGLVCIDVVPFASLANVEEIKKGQRSILLPLKSKLLANPSLAGDEDLAFKVNVITFALSCDDPDALKSYKVACVGTLSEVLRDCAPFGKELQVQINAAIERVANIRPKSRRDQISDQRSKGGVLKKIESEVANLDSWQKAAAIETPNGPQRIRGLAGSGKTIVLALKAAYLHGEHSDWVIGVTFHTRSLTQQMKSLISRFYYEDYRENPDEEMLQVMHSFGSSSEDGVYSKICKAYGIVPRDFSYAKRIYGYDRAFAGICAEILPVVEANPKEIFDVLLVDEAQDFPKEFLRLAYLCTRGNKVVWAYDDLQNLGAYQMTSLAETFGFDADGKPRVQLRNRAKQPREDIVLPICYRNTPWALATAHALGSGIYRSEGLVQHPDDPNLWADIGYELLEGTLKLGENVKLRRSSNATPTFFNDFLAPNDAVQFFKYSDIGEQFREAATLIKKSIVEDELFPHDITVIFPDAIAAAKQATLFKQVLWDFGVDSHIVGVTSSKDAFHMDKKVSISGPYRAKGNESPMVFVLDSEYCASGVELIKKRNILFTAITRSRGWVRVMGVGSSMQILLDEFDKIKAKEYRLEFSIPTEEQLAKMRTIYRDVSDDEMRKVADFGKMLESVSDLSPAALQALPKALRDHILQTLNNLNDI